MTDNGNFLYEKRLSEDTVPNIEYLHRNGIDLNSHPAEWFELFFPRCTSRNTGDNKRVEKCTTNHIKSWTNLRASFAGAGEKYGMYPNFQPFTMEEIMKHLGLYILHGLSPSPQVKMKF